MLKKVVVSAAGVALMLATGLIGLRAQERVETGQLPVSDPSCTFFGPDRNKFTAGSNALEQARLTMSVASKLGAFSSNAQAMPTAPGGSRTGTDQQPSSNTIDKYIFPALAAAGVAPAPPTNDYEFVRRVYLDLTGRIPTGTQMSTFVNDATPNKRALLVHSLVGSSAWLDKWTVWFGDLFQNNSQNSQITRFVPTVVAFNSYVRNSLSSNKPYNQMAKEIITASGMDSYTQGELSYEVGGVVTGGPQQDIFDQQIANTATTFLGLSNLNCLLCHDGRGHLDSINLWGYYTSRYQAWGMASFMSHTDEPRSTVSNNVYYWGLEDNVKFKTDYALNTQTGNRPVRGLTTSKTTVPPVYVLGGATPNKGEDYRVALARMVTSDFQFARAAVNYIWEYFFTVGIVSPSNQFDPMRLDPSNPPSNCPPLAPCTLQPSNPALLNALASDFVASGYDLQVLMKEIVNSQTYQLSSRYNGNWDPSTANLFGRKLVRRLWSEEIHDAITTSSNLMPTYTNTNWGPVNYAMQLPEPLNTPDGGNGAVNNFLNAFLRGNRDDQARRPDGSISQALGLMNDNFVMSRVQPTTGLLKIVLALPNDQLVNTLFWNILSRYPTATEMSDALANLQTASTRTQEAQNLIWSLYNKVDFVFNY
jgi:hypothetical protein